MIVNLTQHPASSEQLASGVFDLEHTARATLREWLTFSTLPTGQEIEERARLLAGVAAGDSRTVDAPSGVVYAMIGGAPFLMSALENALIERGITPLYAFSVRESTEQAQPDGSVRKLNVFRHAGFVQI